MKSANAKALPLAVTDARTQAGQLAAATGATLGPMLSASNSGSSNVLYGPVFYAGSSGGTFGPDKYCGNVRTRSPTVDANGVRHYGKYHTRRTCRIPGTIQRTVTLTFAIA